MLSTICRQRRSWEHSSSATKRYIRISRENSGDGTLNAWLQIYGLKIDPTTQRSSATLDVTIGRDGNAVEKTFTLSNVSETATFTQSFPLTDFDPGVYSIQIKITDNVAGESTVKSGGFIVR